VGDDGQGRLSREQTAAEVVWSAGRTLRSLTVASAFNLSEAERRSIVRDAAPLAAQQGSGWSTSQIIAVVAIIAVIIALSKCGNDDEDCESLRQSFGAASAEYQQCLQRGGSASGTRGGSWGGYSGGGGHK
jgi:hypothetical protein